MSVTAVGASIVFISFSKLFAGFFFMIFIYIIFFWIEDIEDEGEDIVERIVSEYNTKNAIK